MKARDNKLNGVQTLSVKLSGDISPVSVNAKDLAEILTNLQDTLQIMADDSHVELQGAFFCLTGVRPGSVEMLLSASHEAFVPIHDLHKSFKHPVDSKLPKAAHNKLTKLKNIAAKLNCTLSVVGPHAAEQICFTISGDSEIPKPRIPETVSGLTELYGKCVRINADNMEAGFDLLDDEQNRLTVSVGTEKLLTKLGQGLLKRWKLIGEARWDASDLTIKKLHLHSAKIVETNYEDMFRKLAETSEGAWDDVDALDFVREIRDGGEH